MATKERSGAGAGATLLGRTRVWPIALAVAICVAGPAAVAHARALASAPGPENSPLGLARNYVTVDVGADPLQVQKTLLESAFAYGDLASGGAYATGGAGLAEKAASTFGPRSLGAAAARTLPSNARTTTNAVEVFSRLERFHGIDPAVASERLHEIKAAAGHGAADNVIFDLTGNIYEQDRNWIGSLTEGGAKAAR